MAFSHGSKAVFKVQDAAGTLTNISAYLRDVGLPRTADTAEVTTLGKTSKVYIPGLKDGTIPIEGPFDPTIDALLAGILALARNFEYYPAGEVTGQPKYSGSCILTSYEPDTPEDDAASFSGEFQCSDDITRALVP